MGVCVGCGLDVVDGKLVIKGGGACGQEDLGVRCSDEGGMDLAVPMMGLRVVGNLQQETAPVPSTPYNGAVIDQADYTVTHNSAAGVLERQASGIIEVLCDGVYQINITGAPTVSLADQPVTRLLGGRVRLFRDIFNIVASSGMISYDFAGVDFSVGSDGPEWSCGTSQPLTAGQLITWHLLAVSDVVGTTILYPQPANAVTIARLGALR